MSIVSNFALIIADFKTDCTLCYSTVCLGPRWSWEISTLETNQRPSERTPATTTRCSFFVSDKWFSFKMNVYNQWIKPKCFRKMSQTDSKSNHKLIKKRKEKKTFNRVNCQAQKSLSRTDMNTDFSCYIEYQCFRLRVFFGLNMSQFLSPLLSGEIPRTALLTSLNPKVFFFCFFCTERNMWKSRPRISIC